MWASHLFVFLRRTSVELEVSLSSTVGAAMAATARMLEMTMFWKATILEVRQLDLMIGSCEESLLAGIVIACERADVSA